MQNNNFTLGWPIIFQTAIQLRFDRIYQIKPDVMVTMQFVGTLVVLKRKGN